MSNERSTDLDVKRRIFRECAGAAEALARAFKGADLVYQDLSRDAALIVERQLFDVYRRTFRLIEAVGFRSGIIGGIEEDREVTPVISYREKP